MKTVQDILRDADPLRHESSRLEGERGRLLQAVVAAAAEAAAPSSGWFRPAVLSAMLTMIILTLAVLGFQLWPKGGAAVQAAVRFEVRLAEDQPTAGLLEARVVGSDRLVYLHQEIIVTNDDIATSRIIQGAGPSRFGVGVEFNEAGAEKMRRATASHLGRPVAVLIDGEVIIAPVLRGPISTSAVISGDYTKAEAERIVNGIGLR